MEGNGTLRIGIAACRGGSGPSSERKVRAENPNYGASCRTPRPGGFFSVPALRFSRPPTPLIPHGNGSVPSIWSVAPPAGRAQGPARVQFNFVGDCGFRMLCCANGVPANDRGDRRAARRARQMQEM